MTARSADRRLRTCKIVRPRVTAAAHRHHVINLFNTLHSITQRVRQRIHASINAFARSRSPKRSRFSSSVVSISYEFASTRSRAILIATDHDRRSFVSARRAETREPNRASGATASSCDSRRRRRRRRRRRDGVEAGIIISLVIARPARDRVESSRRKARPSMTGKISK